MTRAEVRAAVSRASARGVGLGDHVHRDAAGEGLVGGPPEPGAVGVVEEVVEREASGEDGPRSDRCLGHVPPRSHRVGRAPVALRPHATGARSPPEPAGDQVHDAGHLRDPHRPGQREEHHDVDGAGHAEQASARASPSPGAQTCASPHVDRPGQRRWRRRPRPAPDEEAQQHRRRRGRRASGAAASTSTSAPTRYAPAYASTSPGAVPDGDDAGGRQRPRGPCWSPRSRTAPRTPSGCARGRRSRAASGSGR